jgi:lipopolysaccharide/colanic/teichoic acid biosynthesis glycosyltransferase
MDSHTVSSAKETGAISLDTATVQEPKPHASAPSTKVAKEPLLKRPLDIVLSCFMLILSLPVFLPIALAIKLEDGGPIFYRQERWGKDGRRFWAYKFRTMVPNSDDELGIISARENDHRITRVGQILRAMGLDELPQIINILFGQMSFVGPRSLAVGEIVQDEQGYVVDYEDIPGFWERLRVRPGLTGLATIYIPKDVTPRRKFRYDLLYIRKQSFWLDLKLIVLSFWISFRGKWESRGQKI